MARVVLTGVLAALAARSVSAQTQAMCNPSNQCPQDTPCCSQYGQCGVGAYCLGGCDPLSSFSLNSCTPAPVCKDKTVTFTNMDNLIENTKYLGDASQADFVYSGEPVIYQDQVLLTMPESSVGTLLASTEYMWYGKASATLKTSGGQGVVTAFILLSDVKDEIDFEFVGYNLTQAQTNFYWQGVLDYNNGGNSSVPGGNSMTTNHTYEIDWQPDSITWSIDGNAVRSLQKSSTFNSTSNSYSFPQSPARVQLSLWPAGASTNPPGTVQWSGGPISWSSPYMSNGYYYAAFSQVTMECYKPPQGANVTGSTSYIYTDRAGTNNTVATTNENTTLSSFDATGLNMTIGAASASGSAQPSQSAQVPGQGSAGSGNNGQRGGSGSGSGSGTSSAGGSASTGFVQGSGSSGSGKSSATAVVANEKVFQGSILAAFIALVATCVL